MYLVDTNVWLERLLDQERSAEVQSFLEAIPSDQLFMTDFTFHSIGIVLCKLDQKETLLRFTQDVFVHGAVDLVHIAPKKTERLVSVMRQFNLDFDDAYQYVAAEENDLILISFDTDFDQTKLGKKTPVEVLKQPRK